MINVEMRTENVKKHLRPDLGGIMVLPVSLAQSLARHKLISS
jgi:hypothetical protein